MKNKYSTRSIKDCLLFACGVAVGTFLRWFRLVDKAVTEVVGEIAPELPSDDSDLPPDPPVFVDPKIRTLTDPFGPLNHPMRDTTAVSAERVFECMAQIASDFTAQHYQTTGAKCKRVAVEAQVWTLNLCLRVPVKFDVLYSSEIEYNIVLSVAEQIRLSNLDRALKCFLN